MQIILVLSFFALLLFFVFFWRKSSLRQIQSRFPYKNCLFLDFDGVLHPGFDETFIHIPKFNKLLQKQPHLSVVISSSWRDGRSLASLRALFAKQVHHQIIDETPILRLKNRQAEIELFCKQKKVENYLILDDDEKLFGLTCKNLYMVNHKTGLTTEDFKSINQWANQVRGSSNVSISI